jgi:hypothetical protein
LLKKAFRLALSCKAQRFKLAAKREKSEKLNRSDEKKPAFAGFFDLAIALKRIEFKRS